MTCNDEPLTSVRGFAQCAELSISRAGWFARCKLEPGSETLATNVGAFVSTYVSVESGEHVLSDLSQRGGVWIGAHLDTWLSWPKEPTKVIFEGTPLYLLPETAELRPAVLCLATDNQADAARRLIHRFLSALTWMDRSRANVEIWLSGSPARAGKGRGHAITDYFKYEFLPQHLSEEARLSLAFFREGHSLDHPAYQFLSFYKIINLRFGRSKAQKRWMRENLASVEGEAATKRVMELSKLQDQAPEDYLYESCRCAVAHAGVDPTVDPESQEDDRRLRSDLPLITALAERLIQTEYGIPTRSDVWDRHEYELEGFRACLGNKICSELDTGCYVPRRQVNLKRKVNVRTWSNPQLPGLKGLNLQVLRIEKGVVLVRLRSDDSLTEIQVCLNFPENRLEFEPLVDLEADDDGSATAASRMADMLGFQKEMMLNGCLEIWDSEDITCLGRGNAYIPLNLIVKPEGFDARIKEFRSLANERLASKAGTSE